MNNHGVIIYTFTYLYIINYCILRVKYRDKNI